MSEAQALSALAPPAARSRWVEGPAFDLAWLIGPALLGWLFFGLHLGFGVSVVALYWAWILFLDGPHLLATLSRTYLDKEERRTRRGLLLLAPLWIALPAATLGWGVATGQRLPHFLFLAFVQVWAYWHVVRQHYGFLVLYQRKGGEPAGQADRLGQAIFYAAMLAPFASWVLRHPDARTELGLSAVPGAAEALAAQGLGALALLAVGVHAGRELSRWRRGAQPSLPKNLFLAACWTLHLTVLLHPAWSVAISLPALAIIVTSFHNVQYSAIVWSFARRRYHGDPDGAAYGLASRALRRLVPAYLAAAGITVLARYATWSLDGRYWPFTPTEWTLGGVFSAAEVVGAWWWFVAIHHYYLDQKIWRVSRDPVAQRGLGL